MILALFFLVSLALVVHGALKVRQLFGQMHSPQYGNWTVGLFFDWTRYLIAMLSIALTLLAMVVAEITIGGMSGMWENVTIVTFVVLGILAMLFTITVQGVVYERMHGGTTTDSRRS